jgi:hypothetical protein
VKFVVTRPGLGITVFNLSVNEVPIAREEMPDAENKYDYLDIPKNPANLHKLDLKIF